MSEWKKVKLGELCDFINGGAWSDKEYVSEGIPVLKVTNCKNSGFSLSELSYLPFSLKQKYSQNELRLNDVIIATVGSHPNLINSSAGRSVIVNSFVAGFYLNQNAVCIRTKDSKILNQLFFGYYSKYYLFQHYIQMRGKGAANQMRIAISAIKDYPMPLPPIENQSYIASILSHYDSLIENYQRQIKLLEEAAQRLYKEWFVDYCFPGHENIKIVDGVPDGWDKKTLEDICNLSKRVIQPSDINEGCPYIGLEHMPRKDFCLSEWGNSEEINSSKYEYKEDDILFGKIRPYFHKVGFAINDGYASTDSIIMQSKPGVWALLLMTVFSDQFVNYTSQTCKEGAKMPRADWNQMKKYPVLIASDTIQKEFERQCKLMANKIKANALQIHLLTEARDRLLPKLMSGEINVETAQSVTSELGVRKEQTGSPQASD